MCCLPNKFPLPIFLLINKCDKIERVKRSPWLEKIQLENYVTENQFFNHFFISAEKTSDSNRESSLSNQSVDVDSPLREMMRTIFQFKDIKEKILSSSKKSSTENHNILTKTNTKETKMTNQSSNSEFSNIEFDKSKKDKKDKNCFIL